MALGGTEMSAGNCALLENGVLSLPQEEAQYLGVSFTSEGKIECYSLTGGLVSAVMWTLSCVPDLMVDLHSNPQLWS